ncbi:MAG: carbamoyltransferase HypF [Calditrichaceae bacterium]|nr:carbamoyltransferase HypF [Calditrichaceae bacterium]MBN2709898.1 carbamoyltransferase HypF [Calditrichaceae bacterium]RQV92654.1 MAG: carbamoyltransferase HypF [Calditrichota bacterium]
MISNHKDQRIEMWINGIVQGVGFRPFVYKLAQKFKLTGFVSNHSKGVLIEAQGAQNNLKLFLRSLKVEAPPFSQIIDVNFKNISLKEEEHFTIKTSVDNAEIHTLISPDLCVCDDCLAELFNPDNRRYLYPFINCTNCGPRYTIIEGIPYDRQKTTMSKFKMCPACQQEYDNPTDRRFHAQPNACPACGPRVWYEEVKNNLNRFHDLEAFDETIDAILEGKILAIKGLGGFHLAVDARNHDAVKRLRERKNREEKPLAIMVENLDDIDKIAITTKNDIKLLTGYTRPIVLLKKRNTSLLAENIAPGNPRLGIMLPYTPLHYILFYLLRKKTYGSDFPVLVMTSANISEEPIAIDNDEARARLSKIADAFLMHNRDILIRSDDSVVLTVDKQTQFIRRSRGYVPGPVFILNDGPEILGTGCELKNTLCFLKDNKAFVSQHIGDLENLAAYNFFNESFAHLKKLLKTDPDVIICDMHPGYFSTQWAIQQQGKTIIQVQHHHAHLAACMAEHQIDQQVIGIILDGTGLGTDKKIWGGEVLIGNYTGFRRFAHLEYLPLPGGDAATKEPWRIATGYLQYLFEKDFPDLPALEGFQTPVIRRMTENNINCILTSSCGRLFDAVAAMSGGKAVIRYEAQAAVELMQVVKTLNVKPFDYNINIPEISLKPFLSSVIAALKNGEKFSKIAERFHRTLINIFSEIAQKARKESGVNTVVLSGGVMQNEIILRGLIVALNKEGFRVLYHRQVPANDGGISLGQAIIGRMLVKSGMNKPEYSEFK